MDHIELKVSHREILGKKVRFLRRQGITPVHLFGHGIDSLALQCDTGELRQVVAAAGKTRIINLKIDKEKRPRTVIVRELQTEPRTGQSLHVDFYQVKMAEKVKMDVPIVLSGEAPALKAKDNMLVQELDNLSVECLPAQIPASVELDLSVLTETEQSIRVKDIELDKDIAILDDPEMVVAKITLRHVEKIEELEIEVPEEEIEEELEEEAEEVTEEE